jgi:hypothetical protein
MALDLALATTLDAALDGALAVAFDATARAVGRRH